MAPSETHIPVIKIDGVWKVFGKNPERVFLSEHELKNRSEIQDELGLVVALRDVSFTVNSGQIFVIMGLSGSGKSTLARCLSRLIETTRGKICFDDEDIVTYSAEQLLQFRRNKVAMVFQHYALLPHRRVLDNVAYGLEIRGMDKETCHQVASEAIRTVGLKGWEDYYPNEMSGGMQQRVGLARALAVDPKVLIMDEPFSGLDPLIRREMQDELISLQLKLHKTIVFITHDLNEALKLGDYIAIMRDGEIIQVGSPEEIVTLPTDDYVAEFVQDVSRTKVIQAKTIMREPDVVLYERQGPRAALYIMNSHGLNAMFLIAHDFTLKGILTKQQTEELVSQQRTSLEGVQVMPASIASPDDYIEDIIPTAAKSKYPVAVVSGDRSLLGEIRKDVLLAGMTGSE